MSRKAAAMSRHAADIDDAAGLPVLSMARRSMLGPRIDAADVDGENLIDGRASVSVMLIIGDGIPALLTRQSRRPNHSSVLIDHRLDIGLIRHIRADETNAEPLLERAAFLLAPPDDHHLRAFRDKGLGDAFADAAVPRSRSRSCRPTRPWSPPIGKALAAVSRILSQRRAPRAILYRRAQRVSASISSAVTSFL